MTPRDSDLAHARPRVRASRSFTQGNVTEGPRAGLHRDQLARRREGAPFPMNSLVASAKRLTKKKLQGGSFRKSTAAGWQEDAWEMYDLVGEQHFLGTTLANQASKARFYVGQLGAGADTTDVPDPVDDEVLQGILDSVGGGPIGFSQMVQRMIVNLFVAGDGWLVGIPKQLLPDYEAEDEEEQEAIDAWNADAIEDPEQDDELSMSDLEWRMLSVSEVTIKREGLVTLHLGAEASERVEVSPDLLYMIRVWRPHPRRWWEADSPTRSSLPVLRELVGLTMHISAQVDSRLAGAGLLLVPASAARALKIAAGIPEDSDEDPFTDALMEAMLTPIGDRANASALVPLVVTIPDGTAGDFQYLTFSKPLDTEARSLRDEAIRRLALGQDAPPELLLGTGGMNHWGAWLVRDDVVTTHIEPPLALIADALTTQYLRPIMAEMGYSREQIKNYVVWYDTSKMVVQPNRAADALTLFDRDALSDEALRDANGFDETDAPETSKMDLASQTAFQMVKENPGLMANPGLPALVDQIRALIAGTPKPLPKKGSSSEVAAEPGQAPAPVDENGRPIIVTNNAPQAGGGRTAPEGAAEAQVAQGAPPRNPSVKQGPAMSAETEEFGAFGPFDTEDNDNPDVELGYDVYDASTNPVDDQSDLTDAGDAAPIDLEESAPGPQGAIVVLIPAEADPITAAVQGVDAHMTLAYLAGDIAAEPLPDVKTLLEQAEAAASAVPFTSLTLDSEGVSELGDAAVVTFEATDELHDVFSRLADPATPIGKLNEARNSYPFRPHVSLAYYEDGLTENDVLPEFPRPSVVFDRIGVWVGDQHYDFQLGAPSETQPPTEPLLEEGAETQNPGYASGGPVSQTATVDFMGQPAMNPNFVANRVAPVPESASVVRPLTTHPSRVSAGS